MFHFRVSFLVKVSPTWSVFPTGIRSFTSCHDDHHRHIHEHLWTLWWLSAGWHSAWRAHPSFTPSSFRFLRLSVGWDSHSVILPVLHIIHFPALRLPIVWHLYTRRLLGQEFHGESLGCDTHVPSFLKTNHTDSLLGPPFMSEYKESGNSRWWQKWCVSVVSVGHTPLTCVVLDGTATGRDLCLCFGWERPLHDEVTETWDVVHTKHSDFCIPLFLGV